MEGYNVPGFTEVLSVMEKLRTRPWKPTARFNCTLCRLNFINITHRRQHFATKTHKRKVEEQSRLAVFRPIFKCIRCEVEVGTQEEIRIHAEYLHNVTMPSENKDWLDILSEENKAGDMKKTTTYFCYLCHSSSFCQVANKRHIRLCEQEYLDIRSIEWKVENQIQEDNGTISLAKVQTMSVPLDKLLAGQILSKFNEDIHNFFMKESVGGDFYLKTVASQLRIKASNLRKWLGISSDLEKGEQPEASKPVKLNNGAKRRDRFYCLICQSQFKCAHGLIQHLGTKKHKDKLEGRQSNLSKCSKCRKSFKTLSDCQKHEIGCSGGHECEICGKRFQNLYRVKEHLHTHTDWSPIEPNQGSTSTDPQVILSIINKLPDVLWKPSGPFYCKCCQFNFKKSTHQRRHFLCSERHKRKVKDLLDKMSKEADDNESG